MNNISSVMAKYARNAAARANDLSISPSTPHFVLHQPISQPATRTLPTDQPSIQVRIPNLQEGVIRSIRFF